MRRDTLPLARDPLDLPYDNVVRRTTSSSASGPVAQSELEPSPRERPARPTRYRSKRYSPLRTRPGILTSQRRRITTGRPFQRERISRRRPSQRRADISLAISALNPDTP